ncbi:MAG TPA: hypothetical protein VIJ95_10770 [Hanamia sp.]
MRKLYTLLALVLFFACSKKNDPSPVVTPPSHLRLQVSHLIAAVSPPR